MSQSFISVNCFSLCSKVYCAGWLAAKNEGLSPPEAKVAGMDSRRKCLGTNIEPILLMLWLFVENFLSLEPLPETILLLEPLPETILLLEPWPEAILGGLLSMVHVIIRL